MIITKYICDECRKQLSDAETVYRVCEASIEGDLCFDNGMKSWHFCKKCFKERFKVEV